MKKVIVLFLVLLLTACSRGTFLYVEEEINYQRQSFEYVSGNSFNISNSVFNQLVQFKHLNYHIFSNDNILFYEYNNNFLNRQNNPVVMFFYDQSTSELVTLETGIDSNESFGFLGVSSSNSKLVFHNLNEIIVINQSGEFHSKFLSERVFQDTFLFKNDIIIKYEIYYNGTIQGTSMHTYDLDLTYLASYDDYDYFYVHNYYGIEDILFTKTTSPYGIYTISDQSFNRLYEEVSNVVRFAYIINDNGYVFTGYSSWDYNADNLTSKSFYFIEDELILESDRVFAMNSDYINYRNHVRCDDSINFRFCNKFGEVVSSGYDRSNLPRYNGFAADEIDFLSIPLSPKYKLFKKDSESILELRTYNNKVVASYEIESSDISVSIYGKHIIIRGFNHDSSSASDSYIFIDDSLISYDYLIGSDINSDELYYIRDTKMYQYINEEREYSKPSIFENLHTAKYGYLKEDTFYKIDYNILTKNKFYIEQNSKLLYSGTLIATQSYDIYPYNKSLLVESVLVYDGTTLTEFNILH